MAFTSTDLANLDKAIASGVLTVEYDGKRTTFRSLEELKAIRSEVAAAVLGKPRTRALLVTTSSDKGL